MSNDTGMKDFLAQAKSEYRSTLPRKLDELEQWMGQLEQNPKRREEWKQMFDVVHRLSGTAGSFGLDEIGRVADEWEVKIRELRTRNATEADFSGMRAYIRRIRELLSQGSSVNRACRPKPALRRPRPAKAAKAATTNGPPSLTSEARLLNIRHDREEECMSDIVIKVLKNGPLRVEGKVQMIDPQGNVMAYDKEKFSLCRCGHSSNKPFCDGTHNKIGFQHEEAWVPKPPEPPKAE